MRSSTIIILTTLILLACQPNNSLSTPIITSTPSPITTKAAPLAISTSELSVTPENPEQLAFRLGEEAGLRGEPASDWEKWTDKAYHMMRAIPYDMVDGQMVANAEKMALADIYVYGMRKGSFERFIQQSETQSRDVLRMFYLNFVPGKVDVNTLPALSQTELIEQVKRLLNKEMMYLDLAYHLYMQDKNMPTFEEVRKRLETPKIIGSSNIAAGAFVEGSSGWYGLMMDGNEYYQNTFNNSTYKVNLFGDQVETIGDWMATSSYMDFVGVENLSYGFIDDKGQIQVIEVIGVTGLIRPNKNEIAQGTEPIQLIDLGVILDGQQPIIFPEGTKYPAGGFTLIPLSEVPRIELNKTLFADRFNEVYRGNLDWTKFTEGDLLNKLTIPPTIIEVRSSQEQQIIGGPAGSMIQTILPHPVWGIQMIAQSDRETGVVQSGKPANDRSAVGIGATGINFWDPTILVNPWLP